MSISFKEIVKNVILEEAYGTVEDAISDTNGWLKKIEIKVGVANFLDTWSITYAATMGARYFAKKNINENLIALQDLIRFLAFHRDIKPEKSAVLPELIFIDKVQEQYLIKGSNVNRAIEGWLSREIDPDEGYRFLEPNVHREWLQFRKDKDIVANAAFSQYISQYLFPGVIKVIDYKTRNRQGILTGKLGSIGTFEGLIKDVFQSVNEYVVGAKNQPIGITVKNISNKILGSASVKQFEADVEDTSIMDIIRLAISSRELFTAEIKNQIIAEFEKHKTELQGNNITGNLDIGSISDFYITGSNNTNVRSVEAENKAFMQFIKQGTLNDINVRVTLQDEGAGATTTQQIKLSTTNKYTIGDIEKLNTEQSRAVVQLFKAFCFFVNRGESSRGAQVGAVMTGLNQAAGVKL